MKKILLPVLLGLPFAVSQLFGGPEPLPSGKEMKSVVQPAVEQECNWTGFYVGVHVGYGWGDLKWTDTDTNTFSFEPGGGTPDLSGPTVLDEGSADGIIVGGQAGYNYQFGHFVVGVEGEFSYSDVSNTSSSSTESFVNRFETNSDWLGTIGFRAGF